MAYLELRIKGVIERVPVTPEQARRFVQGEMLLARNPEPAVAEDGQLIEDEREQ